MWIKRVKLTRNEIERLIAGESIEKQIRLDLTYDEIDSSIENLWSVLFTTGYLTHTEISEEGTYKLVSSEQGSQGSIQAADTGMV